MAQPPAQARLLPVFIIIHTRARGLPIHWVPFAAFLSFPVARMHPHRNTLHNELHARPSMYFDAPAQVFHLAFLDEDDAAQAIIRSLCDRHVALADPALPQGEFPIGAARLKWERHTEFLTLTLVLPGSQPTAWAALPPVLAEVAETYSALLINAAQVCVESESSWRGSIQD